MPTQNRLKLFEKKGIIAKPITIQNKSVAMVDFLRKA